MNQAVATRLKSLDVFRGVTIASMILVNSVGSKGVGYSELLHAPWHGWNLADTIFPAFLWIIGVSMTLSTARRLARGESRGDLLRHAFTRALLLFLCGIFLDAFSFPNRSFPFFTLHLEYLRLTGVLQKIAVCYLFAFAIYLWSGWRGVVIGVVALNLVYLGFMLHYPVPGCGAGVLTMPCNFAGYLDGKLLAGHMWDRPGVQDPDGLGSVLPAASTILLGALVGFLLRIGWSSQKLLSILIAAGSTQTIFGIFLSRFVIPINKPLWTTSYAIFMAGLASLSFALAYWFVDVRQQSKWTKPFEIFGLNAVAAYMISRICQNIPKVHFFGRSFYADVCQRLASGAAASLIYATCYLFGVYLVIYWMYKRNWFLKF